MSLLPDFVIQQQQEQQFDNNVVLLYEFLLSNGLSMEEINEIPLWLFFRMLKDFKLLLKMKGVLIKD